MFCYKVNPETNNVYAMTHSCNPLYLESDLPLCPYAHTDECEGTCGIEFDEIIAEEKASYVSYSCSEEEFKQHCEEEKENSKEFFEDPGKFMEMMKDFV